jgi:hypothetical protein
MHRLVLHTLRTSEPRRTGRKQAGLLPASERQFTDDHIVRHHGFCGEQRVQLRVEPSLMSNPRTRIDEHSFRDRFIPRR